MTIKAALLDERGVYLRMDEVESAAQLTARHVPSVTSCDLKPGEYLWIASSNPKNPYGGAFWPLAWLDRFKGVEVKRGKRVIHTGPDTRPQVIAQLARI